MKKALVFSLVVASAFVTWSAIAGPNCGSGDKAATCPVMAKAQGAMVASVYDRVTDVLPTISYRVGDYTSSCCKSAKARAEEHAASIVYVVGDKQFETEKEANAHLVSLLHSEIEKLQKVRYSANGDCYSCPHAATAAAKAHGEDMKYTVAGFTFDSKDDATHVADVVSAALAKMAEQSEAGRASEKGCASSCGTKAETASAKKGCDTPCDSPCGDKGAQAASAKNNDCATKCGSKAVTASAKKAEKGCDKPCDSPCGDKAAQTASAQESDCASKCGSEAKEAKVASAKKSGCGSACGDKSADTASDCSGCKPKCCASEQVAAAYGKLRAMIEAAATASNGASSS